MSEEHPFYRLHSVGGFRDADQQGKSSDKEKVRPQTVEYSSAWLNFLIVMCLLVAWYFPLKILISYWLWPTVDRGPRQSHEFVALAYEGVSEKDTDVKPTQFKDHLDTLIANGYNPITLEDIRDLYQENKLLPKNSVFLSFDHSRKSSFFDTRSYLRRDGWFATLFLWIKPIEDMDRSSLLWPYLRAMLRSDSWEVGAQSYNGFAKVPSSPKGQVGNFMTTPKWLEEEGRYETLKEFSERLESDHERCIGMIKDKLGVEPIAYAYPYGDFGQYKSGATVIHAVNLALVEKNYDLGFLTGKLALNTKYSDPRRLNRLLVDANWNGEDLVNYLDKCWPVKNPALGTRGASELPWVVDWGSTEQGIDGDISLFAPPQTTGAKMWLAGSDLNKDFYAKVRFRLMRGQLGLYLRATPDSESYVYLGLDTGGDVWLRQMKKTEEGEKGDIPPKENRSDVWLRQKEITTERFTLASSHVNITPQTEHTVEVFLRENMLFARLDGGKIFKQRAILRGIQRPGMFGLSIWDAEPGQARVAIENVELHQQDKSMLCWNSSDKDYDPYMFKWVHDNSYRITDISFDWLTVDSLGRPQESGIKPSNYSLLARINHLNIYPRVTIDDDNDMTVLTPQLLAKKVSEAGVDGVYLNMENLISGAGKVLVNWLNRTSEALNKLGCELVMSLPPKLNTKTQLVSVMAMMPNSKIVLDKDSELAKDPDIKNKSVVDKEELSQPSAKSEIPIFYQIESMKGASFEESIESRAERLYNEGMASYKLGDYDAALKSWLEWLKMEPENSRVLMLLGDVEARRGNIDTAIAYYDRSLEIDPGQITLEMRRIRLLETLGRQEESVKSLNLYARLFPANTDILIAQAEWLERHERTKEAIDVARKVVALEPSNMKALAFIMLYAEQRQDRIEARDSIIALGENPNNQYELGKLIWDYELLAIDDSEPLMRLATRIASESKDARVKDIFNRLRPRYNSVLETFTDNRMSEDWWVLGGRYTISDNRALLQSSGTHKEISMRLLGSQHLSQSYVECTIDDYSHDFWLYARRGGKHMIRFGFTTDNYIYLQLWTNGNLTSNQKKIWNKPTGSFTLRLEVCADGIIGYVNGEPAFTPYPNIPESVGQGWVGVAASASQTGVASAVISSISAGPTPTRIAILEPSLSADMSDNQLQTIRSNVSAMMAVCPKWYSADMSGNWSDNYEGDKELYRLFSRYYRFWLMPAVQVSNIEAINSAAIKSFAEGLKIDGLLLLTPEWPSTVWFDKMNKQLASSNLKIVIAKHNPGGNSITLQGIGNGRIMFSDRSIASDFNLYNAQDLPDAAKPENRNNPLIFKL